MTVVLTPLADMDPVPRIAVSIAAADVPAGTDKVTFWRTHEGREFKVRGGVDRVMVSAISLLDYEAPFGIVSTYSAECWDGDLPLGRVALGTATLSFTGTVVQQPLDASLNAQVILKLGTAETSSRLSPGSLVNPEGAVLPSFVGFGPRRGLQRFTLLMDTHSVAQADALQATLGTYQEPQLPIWCVRTSLPARMPRVLFCHVPELVERDENVQYGGTVVGFSAIVDEVNPPAAALVLSSLSYDDIDISYASYTTMDAAYASYDIRDRDWSLSGAAG